MTTEGSERSGRGAGGAAADSLVNRVDGGTLRGKKVPGSGAQVGSSMQAHHGCGVPCMTNNTGLND